MHQRATKKKGGSIKTASECRSDCSGNQIQIINAPACNKKMNVHVDPLTRHKSAAVIVAANKYE